MDKALLFQYWDSIGRENIFLDEYGLSFQMFGYNKYDFNDTWFIDWFGGVDEVIKYFELLQDKEFTINSNNNYDFNIKINNITFDKNEDMFDCIATTKYKGKIMVNNEIYDIKEESRGGMSDIMVDISWEMRAIINDFFDKNIPAGFLLRCINLKFI